MLIKKPTQAAKILEVLKEAKLAGGEGWVNGGYFLHGMFLSQYHARIFELEQQGCVIEHGKVKDEHGFVSYRLLSVPEMQNN